MGSLAILVTVADLFLWCLMATIIARRWALSVAEEVRGLELNVLPWMLQLFFIVFLGGLTFELDKLVERPSAFKILPMVATIPALVVSGRFFHRRYVETDRRPSLKRMISAGDTERLLSLALSLLFFWMLLSALETGTTGIGSKYGGRIIEVEGPVVYLFCVAYLLVGSGMAIFGVFSNGKYIKNRSLGKFSYGSTVSGFVLYGATLVLYGICSWFGLA